ncbi:TRAP transporter small permease [Vibrio furnissii]|uniref:TRAP transporter small permease n=1 Tax=Vibrio furnissii TaxID=29494 RepID=UPI0023DB4C20|nr:TRAP transporter small permease [Vibrio furnissii]
MTVLKKLINRVSQAMHVCSGAFLIGMMLVTLLDVVTRTLYGLSDGGIELTFVGGVELIKYGLLFTVLFTLPQSVGDSQVVVDLFTEQMSDRFKTYLESFYLLGFTLLGAGMTYRFYLAIEGAVMSGETTQDLMIPMPWIYRIVVFATSMLTLRCLILTWDLLRHHHPKIERMSSQTSPPSNHQHNEVL